MPKIQANGIELFYDVQGTGEPLLFIAGFMCDRTYWSLVMPSFVKQYQVIRLDNRGIGQSSAPNSPYTIKQMASDAGALLDHLGINKVHVAGHCMGGQIAQELVLAHPEKVCSLMLLSSWAKADGLFNAVIETWGDLPQTLDLKLYEKVILPGYLPMSSTLSLGRLNKLSTWQSITPSRLRLMDCIITGLS